MKPLFRSLAAGLIAAFAFAPHQAAAVPVDVQLSLLVDVSGSIDAGEFALQRDGYANAFRDEGIQNLILSKDDGRHGQIAVNYIYWASSSQQRLAVGWTLIDSIDAANSFADAISDYTRPFNGNTGIGAAIEYAVDTFTNSGYDATSKVIDVSGDGINNSGLQPAAARDAALAAGIDRINGLAIQDPGLLAYYQSNVQGGTDAFTIFASDFDSFGNAVRNKLRYEITGTTPIPLPAPVFLLIGGLFGMGVMARRKRAA